MKRIFLVTILLSCGIQSADLPDQSKKIDYAKLFRRSGLNDDPTSIYYYLEDKNEAALTQLIDQAKKDGMFDILEKALGYAVADKKLRAVSTLLNNHVPIQSDIIKKAVDFLLHLGEMDAAKAQLYRDEKRMFSRIIEGIMTPGRKTDFDFLVSYVIKKKEQGFLNWLLFKAINLGNIAYVDLLINQGAVIVNQTHYQNAIRRLTEIRNNQMNLKDKMHINEIIESLVDALERHITKRINKEQRGQ